MRQYTEDRELTAWLLLDRSRSMEFGPRDRGKDVVLTELAVTLARLLARGGNRVGALLYDERLERIVPPRTGRTHVLRLSHELTKPRPSGGRPGTTTDLAALLRVGAVHDPPPFAGVPHLRLHHRDRAGSARCRRLVQRHEVVAVRLVDPLERELPEVGLIVVEDAETGEQVVADTSDPEFRRRFHARGRCPGAGAAGARSAVPGLGSTTSPPTTTSRPRWSRWSAARGSRRR